VRRGDEIETRSLALPRELLIRLVWTGHAARTSELVGKVQALRRDDPPAHRRCIEQLSALSEEFAKAFEAGDAHDLVSVAASYSTAMGALGRAARAPIVDPRLLRVNELAQRFSGSAKPCGAGGGDVGVAFFTDVGAANEFELACIGEGLHPIDVSWGATGVRAS
jgi:mevalonate kinase